MWVLLTVLLFGAFSSMGASLYSFIIIFLVMLSTASLPAQNHSAQSSGLVFLRETVRHAVRQIKMISIVKDCALRTYIYSQCVSVQDYSVLSLDPQ